MFKFYTIPSKDLISKIIGDEATIKLSSAFNLNDPYELKFNLDVDPLADGQQEEYYRNNPGSSEEDFKSWQEQVFENQGFAWYTEQQQRNAVAQAIALCSFSESNNNNLMWSHYTNNHKGICVEYSAELFDYLIKMNGFLAFWKVNYSDEPPIVKGLEDIKLKIEKVMFNKQSEWKYEKEHRIVYYSDKDTEYIPIDRKYIKAIYIGSRADNEIISKILSVCNNTNVEIYYGITLGKSYEVNFLKHKDGVFYSRAFWR